MLKIGELLSLQLDSTKKNDIVNIIIKITTGALGRIFWTLTTNMGVIEKAKPIINMKQEFLYKRIMLTNNKKSLKICISIKTIHYSLEELYERCNRL